MEIYLDVLIIVNIIVNYYLILLTFYILKQRYKNFRIIIASILGSIFSLYIFVPAKNIVLEILVKTLSAALMIIVSVGYINLKAFIRNFAVLILSSILYLGAISALWMFFKWDTIIINNSTVYLNISPLFLIAFSIIFYLIFSLLGSILKRRTIKAIRCSVELYFLDKICEFIGIFDTGNSVKDVFSNSEIMFIDSRAASEIFNDNPVNYLQNYRLIPCNTVSGSSLLEAVRIDKAVLKLDNQSFTIFKPIVAISKENFDKEYSIILNPEILVNVEGNYATKNTSTKSN